MNKYIIWGTGARLKKNIELIDLNEVCCFIDSNISEENVVLYGIQVKNPQEVSMVGIDKIIIMSEKYYDEIARELIWKYKVPINKIIGFEYYLQSKKSDTEYAHLIYRRYQIRLINIINKFIPQCRIYDPKLDIYKSYESEIDTAIFLIGNKTNNINKAIWNRYDYLLDENNKETISYDLLIAYGKYMDIFSEYYDSINCEICSVEKADRYDNNTIIYYGFRFRFENPNSRDKIQIFQVTHKEFQPVNLSCYIPINVNRNIRLTGIYFVDCDGDNISEYNSKINECTALYWIWKNDHSDIIGLNHYRRVFASIFDKSMALREPEIRLLMSHYDIIVAEKVVFDKLNVRETLRREVCSEAFDRTYIVLENIFAEMDIDNQESFKYVMDGYVMYPCNMFITRREILDKYCKWLFPILFKLIAGVNIDPLWDDYSKRIIGFFAERMLTVWLLQQSYSFKELPIIFTE